MNALFDLWVKGGPAVIAIMILSVVLYGRCTHLLVSLWLSRRRLLAEARVGRIERVELSLRLDAVEELFRRERIILGSMIAAAPLLGLLGTVNGMVKTFATLTERGTSQSMEGLAQGISEVLVATESGLLVAIPALLLLALAHRGMRRNIIEINRLATRAIGQEARPA